MKKDILGPAALFVCVLTAFPASFVFSSQTESSASEKARTLQMIAPYRTWGKVNKQPIVLSVDSIDGLGG
jgi:hypothetical protein